MEKVRAKRDLIVRKNKDGLVPLVTDVESLELETSELPNGSSSRWLLTPVLAGALGAAVLGGLAIGLFGNSATAPGPAQAAVNKSTGSGGGLIPSANPAGNSEVLAVRNLNGGFVYPEVTQDQLPYSRENTQVLDAEIKSVTAENSDITTIAKTPPPEPVDQTFKIPASSTLYSELIDRGVPKTAVEGLLSAIDEVTPADQIKAGTEVVVTLDRQIDFYGREVTFPVELSFNVTGKGPITVKSDDEGRFAASLVKETPSQPQQPAVQTAEVTQFHTVSKVGAGIFTTAQDRNIPDYIASEFSHVFSYDVDFQNQVKASDTFEVFYGNPLSGSSSKRKVLHMARLTIDGETRTFYRFTTADGTTAYFDEDGQSASRSLLRTPVNGAHLTSGFGMRVHPLQGYTKMHTGVDFGAPWGTPIHAAGDGEISQAGQNGGYGNVITIKHTANTQTLYAHMARFASGIREGVHVNQGQVIGYVGSTGRSTGPHLHFEVRIDDEPVNPLEVRSAGGRELEGKDMTNFKAQRQKIMAMMENAPSSAAIAQNGP